MPASAPAIVRPDTVTVFAAPTLALANAPVADAVLSACVLACWTKVGAIPTAETAG